MAFARPILPPGKLVKMSGLRLVVALLSASVHLAWPAPVQVMVVSEWANLDFRLQLRRTFKGCWPHCHGVGIEQLFFMGDVKGTPAEDGSGQQEQDMFGDLVFLGGPDTDEPAAPGQNPRLRVQAQLPTSRAYRLASGLHWILQNRQDVEYVVKIQDDCFVHLPRLVQHMAQNQNASLAMGWISQVPLTIGSHLEKACETCDINEEHTKLCMQGIQQLASGVDMYGCLAILKECVENGIEGSKEQLQLCLWRAHEVDGQAASYFGASHTPNILAESMFVLGRGLVDYIGENFMDLKMRGAADLSLGFWLIALEDVHFVDLPDDLLWESPDAETCPPDGYLLVRSAPTEDASAQVLQGWPARFDDEKCELRCEASA
eukprot:TRINITY_DN64773_c0_g1_i1.p1 TRINITY_DN64773_c0_g1~~TRINITY_DN64773_c0_g1_i1.p1  ORF type:complete len:375 (+),score=87.95 TRINITY_DN64773_c0_g1_i1:106-1230(+)